MVNTYQEWLAWLDDVGLQIQREMTSLLRQQIEMGIRPFARQWNYRMDAIQRAADAKKAHFEEVKHEPRLQNSTSQAPYPNWEWDPSYLAEIVCQPPASKIAYVVGGRREEYDCGRYSSWLMPARLAENLCSVLRETADHKHANDQAIAIIESQLWELTSQQIATEWIVVTREWWTYLKIPRSQAVGCWRPPLAPIPPDPCQDLLRLSPPERVVVGKLGDAEIRIVEGAFDRTAVPPLADEACEMERNCVLVAGLHDRVDHTAKVSAPVWPEELLSNVVACLEQGWCHGLTETFLKSAWNNVRQSVTVDGADSLRTHAERPHVGTAPNVFKQLGDTGYYVRFQGGEPKVIGRQKGKLPGLDQIHVLLEHEANRHRSPGRVIGPMTSDEVQRGAARAPSDLAADGPHPEARMDSEAQRRIQAERERLEMVIDDESANPSDRVAAEEDLARLNHTVDRDTRPGSGRPKSKSLGVIKADSIRRNINRAIAAIHEQEPGLAKHLKSFIRHCDGHIYAPDVHMDWDLG